MPLEKLATGYALLRGSMYKGRAQEYLETLRFRAQLTDAQVANIESETVHVGDPELVALAAWGKPTRINTTNTGGRISEQWVYERGAFGTGFLYVENGFVTAIQNLGRS